MSSCESFKRSDLFRYDDMHIVLVAFSSLAKNMGECLTIRSPPGLFFFFFGGGVEISSRTLIPLFRPGSVHSGSTI